MGTREFLTLSLLSDQSAIFLLKNLLCKSDQEAHISISVHVQRYVKGGYENVLVHIKNLL